MQLVRISCPECKSEIDVDSNFCLNCGYKIKNSSHFDEKKKNQVYKSKYSDTSILKQVQDPSLTTVQSIAILEISLGLIFSIGTIITSWVYYFMGYAIEYGREIDSIPFEYLNIIERLFGNIDFLLIFIFVYGILCIIFGAGLYSFKSWGKIGTLGVSAIGLLYFPVGTIPGIIVIYYLTRNEISSLVKK